MRHRKLGRQFGRNTSHRRAMFRALTANLLLHERIETTDAKAKELRRIAERLITKARRLGSVAYTPQDKLSTEQRQRRAAVQQHIGQFLQRFGVDKNQEPVDLLEKLMVDLTKRFEKRPGGYTRIIKLGRRRGDNAPMSLIELVEADAPEKPEKKVKAPKKPAAKAEESAKPEAAEAPAEG